MKPIGLLMEFKLVERDCCPTSGSCKIPLSLLFVEGDGLSLDLESKLIYGLNIHWRSCLSNWLVTFQGEHVGVSFTPFLLSLLCHHGYFTLSQGTLFPRRSFYPYEVFDVREVFNDALSICVHRLYIAFLSGHLRQLVPQPQLFLALFAA